jgi:hypothetical protein
MKSGAGGSLPRPGSQPLIILGTFRWIYQNPISLGDLLETLLSSWITGVAVRMISEGQPAIGFPDLFSRTVSRQLQNSVVVIHGG